MSRSRTMSPLQSLLRVIAIYCLWIGKHEGKPLKRAGNSTSLLINKLQQQVGQRSNYNSTNCPGCAESTTAPPTRESRLTLQQEETIRRLIIKQEILSKLGRKEPPRVNISFPRGVLYKVLEKVEPPSESENRALGGGYYAEISNIISFSENANSTSDNIIQFSFKAKNPTQSLRVKNASVYLLARYKKRRHTKRHSKRHKVKRHNRAKKQLTIHIYHIDNDNKTEKRISFIQRVIRHTRLVRVPIPPKIIEQVFDTPARSFQIRVVCQSCGSDVNLVMVRRGRHTKRAASHGAKTHGKRRSERKNYRRPFLVVKTASAPNKSVKKRDIDCANDNSRKRCCKRELELKFSDIGWDNWIIAPRSFKRNYCDGECTLGGDLITNSQSTIKGSMKMTNPGLPITFCCMPKRWSSLSILYYDENNNIVKTDMDRMIIEECGCY